MRTLKTKNKGRKTVEVKVTLKPEIAILMDSAIQLKNPDLTRSGFMKYCLTKELRQITLGDI
tara:strand:- start:119 stop:304 length:186 start_codon:yes stop_codon:yes gene_type:complete